MRLFDTHCHFESSSQEEISSIISRAKSDGVAKILAVGGSIELNASALAAREEGCLAALGYDRDQIDVALPSVEDDAGICAWGEIGLDYYYSPETREKQLAFFLSQLEEASRRDLPVVIHTRYADDDTLGALRDVSSRGIIHCFTGEWAFAKKLLDLGFFISYSGIVTFRAADNVRESALLVPDDRILIETDSPFLAPVPMRGKKNEPAFLKHTCSFLAALRKTSTEEFAELTFLNGERALS
jgi:TatD DNase family protein